MLDSPEGVCAGQARFEYPATSVPFSMSSVAYGAQTTAQPGAHPMQPNGDPSAAPVGTWETSTGSKGQQPRGFVLFADKLHAPWRQGA
jgi:hypothetical protein